MDPSLLRDICQMQHISSSIPSPLQLPILTVKSILAPDSFPSDSQGLFHSLLLHRREKHFVILVHHSLLLHLAWLRCWQTHRVNPFPENDHSGCEHLTGCWHGSLTSNTFYLQRSRMFPRFSPPAFDAFQSVGRGRTGKNLNSYLCFKRKAYSLPSRVSVSFCRNIPISVQCHDHEGSNFAVTA